jgi:hypothetical protein
MKGLRAERSLDCFRSIMSHAARRGLDRTAFSRTFNAP